MVLDGLRKSFRNSCCGKRRQYLLRTESILQEKKSLRCKIQLLDGSDISLRIRKHATGNDLVMEVLRHLDLVEKGYFGLQYVDRSQLPRWLDPTKEVRKQMKIGPPFTLHFRVKFYVSEPHLLNEELSKYHFFLQLKRDVVEGKVQPSRKQAVDMGAYAVQSELGDFDDALHHGNYVSEFQLVKDQTQEIDRAIEKKHRLLAGLTPAECEAKYLKIAENLEDYGLDRYEVIGEDGKTCVVGLTPTGIFVMKNGEKVGDHKWKNITNITFKRSRFILCAKNGNGETHEDRIPSTEYRFELPSSRESKLLWQLAIEHHRFFQSLERTTTSHVTSHVGRKGAKFKRTRSEWLTQRSTMGYIRVGSTVWARAVNGDYYRGIVTVMTNKVFVKFNNGDSVAHEKNEDTNVVYDMPPNADELKIGTHVIAHWSGVSAYLPGTITRIDGNRYHVLYDDRDKGVNRIDQMRVLKPPLYFGPGSGRTNIQKRFSMKTTTLDGPSDGSSTTHASKRTQVDVRQKRGLETKVIKQESKSKSLHASINYGEIPRPLNKSIESLRGLNRSSASLRDLNRSGEILTALNRSSKSLGALNRSSESLRASYKSSGSIRSLNGSNESVRTSNQSSESLPALNKPIEIALNVSTESDLSRISKLALNRSSESFCGLKKSSESLRALNGSQESFSVSNKSNNDSVPALKNESNDSFRTPPNESNESFRTPPNKSSESFRVPGKYSDCSRIPNDKFNVQASSNKYKGLYISDVPLVHRTMSNLESGRRYKVTNL